MSERVKIYLKTGFVFRGEITQKDDVFVTLLDTKTGRLMTFPTSSIDRIEKLERGGY